MCVYSRTNLGSEGEFWACLHLATRRRLINRRAAETNCELISKLHAINLAPCRVKGMYSTQAGGEEEGWVRGDTSQRERIGALVPRL